MKAIEQQIFERSNRTVKKIKRDTAKTAKIKYDINSIGEDEDDN